MIICDGFVGNVLVKFCEALGGRICEWLQNELQGKLPQNEIKGMTDKLLATTNAAGIMGGGPLWAVDGVSVICHGRSKANEIAGAIAQAKSA